ncbi:LOW QUALITY PROTEIN: doublecortin domain-containing protein 2C [Megaptera novaeangliae]
MELLAKLAAAVNVAGGVSAGGGGGAPAARLSGGGAHGRRRAAGEARAAGSRAPHVLVDPAPARTIVVCRSGDPFYVGRKFVPSRRRVATFEALLERLTEQGEVPFAARRLFTPTRGTPGSELDALQAAGKYVAAGRERFRKLDYFNIVPSKPEKMRKLKEIKPVVHCDISVPSRWRTFHHLSRQITMVTCTCEVPGNPAQCSLRGRSSPNGSHFLPILHMLCRFGILGMKIPDLKLQTAPSLLPGSVRNGRNFGLCKGATHTSEILPLVFTNGRLFLLPVKTVIPKFSLTGWNCVLDTIREKVFPLRGVRKLFTMNGHLLDNSEDLQDNHFYRAGLEAFKYFPYWKSPKVPSEVQHGLKVPGGGEIGSPSVEKCGRDADLPTRHVRRQHFMECFCLPRQVLKPVLGCSSADLMTTPKKQYYQSCVIETPWDSVEDPKVKETHKYDNIPPKALDSIFYAKEGRKKPKAEPLIQSGADGDVYKAQTPNKETQGAPEVKEAPDVHVEVPVDQKPAEIVKEETHGHMPNFESNKHLSRTSARVRKWFRFLSFPSPEVYLQLLCDLLTR